MAVVGRKLGSFGWHRNSFSEKDRLQKEMDKLHNAFAGRKVIAPTAEFSSSQRAYQD